MKFVFVRHGQRIDDSDSGLTPKGEEQARRAGQFLAGLGLKPDAMVRTKTERTKRTMELVLEELRHECPIVVRESGFSPRRPDYKGDAQAWVQEAKVPVHTLVMVGHNAQQTVLVGKFKQALIAKYNRDRVPKATRVVMCFDIDDRGEWALGECYFGD